MGTTTLITRVRHLAARMGIKSSQSLPSNVESDLKGIVQEVLRELYRHANWEFLFHYERVTLRAMVNAGTVAVTADGTAWTGTGTAFPSTVTARWRMRSDGEVYRITSLDSATGATATDAALTTLSGESYELYADEYPLSTNLKRVTSAWLDGSQEADMEILTQPELSSLKAMRFVFGHPQFCAPAGVDANGYTLLQFYPIPGYTEVLHLQGVKKGTIPTSDSDTDDVPDEFSDVVDKLARAKLYGDYLQETDKTRLQVAASDAGMALARMVMQAQVNKGPMRMALDPKLYGERHMGHFRKVN